MREPKTSLDQSRLAKRDKIREIISQRDISRERKIKQESGLCSTTSTPNCRAREVLPTLGAAARSIRPRKPRVASSRGGIVF